MYTEKVIDEPGPTVLNTSVTFASFLYICKWVDGMGVNIQKQEKYELM